VIQIPRTVVRKFRAVLRKTVLSGSPQPRPAVLLQAGRDGLVLRAQSTHVAVEYDLPGKFGPEQLAISLDALERIEGKDDSLVSLDAASSDKVVARWTDGGIPQLAEFDLVDPKTLPQFPSRPDSWASQGPELLHALCDASQSADASPVKYALHMIQLQGKTGSVVGTDGRQLFLQSGFRFPFSGDMLVPQVPFFGCREFAGISAVEIGQTEKHLAIRVSPWTVHLRIDHESRFPQVDSIIPKANAALATLRMSSDDADFLTQTLPRLPGHDEPDSPVTIDCDGRVVVRTVAAGQEVPTEVILAQSEVAGPTIRCASNRMYLARALSLGFREFRLFGPGSLTHCHDGQRQYMWMGLSKEAIVAPADDAIRITSPDAAQAATKNGEAKKPVHPSPTTNGKSNGKGPARTAAKKGHGIATVIEEAQALKTVLRDAYRRSSQLVVSLKRHRKQAKLMRSTIATLRQLAPLEQ
jgi:hypothetical protein